MKLSRMIKWIGDIDQKNFDRVLGRIMDLIEEAPKEPIGLFLFSNGGEIDVGFSFYDNMKILKPKLITIGTGTVRSIAPLILASGKVRLLMPNTTLFFHDFYVMDISAESTLGPKRLITFGKELNAGMKNYCNILSERSGGLLSPSKMKRFMTNETSISANEAVKLGLADAVADTNMFKLK